MNRVHKMWVVRLFCYWLIGFLVLFHMHAAYFAIKLTNEA